MKLHFDKYWTRKFDKNKDEGEYGAGTLLSTIEVLENVVGICANKIMSMQEEIVELTKRTKESNTSR